MYIHVYTHCICIFLMTVFMTVFGLQNGEAIAIVCLRFSCCNDIYVGNSGEPPLPTMVGYHDVCLHFLVINTSWLVKREKTLRFQAIKQPSTIKKNPRAVDFNRLLSTICG